MKQITNKDLQKCEFEILKSVASFCEENGLRYSLAYGTLLGAIRHKGFIPWDDDVDIMMPRSDYEVFLRTYKDEKYYIRAVELDEKYPYPFAKCIDDTIILDEHIRGYNTIGAYIDIFPLDGLPNGEHDIKKVYKRVVRRWLILGLGTRQWRYRKKKKPIRDLIKEILHIVCHPYRKQVINKMIDSARKYDYDSSAFVGNQSFGKYGLKNALEKEKLGCFTQVMFEGQLFKAFQGYDYYLCHMYGDYMTIPDEGHREKHVNDIRWNLKKVEET